MDSAPRPMTSNPIISTLKGWGVPLTVVGALVVGVVSGLLLVFGADPVAAFGAMWVGAFGTENATAETLVKATPILFVAIGVSLAFRSGVTNIGGEGQMMMGALAGTAVTLQIGESLGGWVIPVGLVTGFLAGGIYGGLAGYLKAHFDVNEILSTIMLNQIAVQVMNYLLNGPMLDPSLAGMNNIPQTARIAAVAQLPRLSIEVGGLELFSRTRLHTGFLLAVVLAVVVHVILWRTTVGYRMRAVGHNPRAARYAGIRVERQMVLAMFIAGGCAGLAGVVQVLGLNYRLQTDGSPVGFTGNAGFNGIVAALFGGLNPILSIFSSVFFGGLLIGAQRMQRELGIPAAMITAINGLIVIFIVSSQRFFRRSPAQTAQPIPQPTADPNPTQPERVV